MALKLGQKDGGGVGGFTERLWDGGDVEGGETAVTPPKPQGRKRTTGRAGCKGWGLDLMHLAKFRSKTKKLLEGDNNTLLSPSC